MRWRKGNRRKGIASRTGRDEDAYRAYVLLPEDGNEGFSAVVHWPGEDYGRLIGVTRTIESAQAMASLYITRVFMGASRDVVEHAEARVANAEKSRCPTAAGRA